MTENDVIPDHINISLPQIDKEYQQILYVKRGGVLRYDSMDTVMILVDSGKVSKDVHERELYMVVDIDGKLLYYSMGNIIDDLYGEGALHLADIDGDGCCEIFFESIVSGNMWNDTMIFKVTENQIILMKDFEPFFQDVKFIISDVGDIILCGSDWNYNLGGFSEYIPELSNVTEPYLLYSLSVGQPFGLKPIDIDNDGIFEISFSFDVLFDNNSLLTTLDIICKYDTTTNEFVTLSLQLIIKKKAPFFASSSHVSDPRHFAHRPSDTLNTYLSPR